MRKIFAITLCLTVGLSSLKAQTYVGYTYNNYESASGMIFNPASIAGSNYKFDVNLFSLNSTFGTNAYTVNRSSLFKFDFSNWTEGKDYTKLDSSDPKDLWMNVDVIGPSFMVSLSPKHSIGFSSRMRFLANENNLSNDIFQLIGSDKDNAIYGQTFTQDNQSMYIHGFADLGLTYARVLYENRNHTLKGGITAKWVLGLGSGSLRSDNIKVNLQDASYITQLQGDVSTAYSKGIDDLVAGDIDNIFDYIDAKGFAMDIGAVYEWTSETNRAAAENGTWFIPTTYKLRAAISVSDLGNRLNYTTSTNSGNYNVNMNGVSTDVLNLDDRSLDEYISDLENAGYVTMSSDQSLKMSLPTLLRANVDWQAWKRIYVNLDGAFSLVGKNTVGARYISSYAVTPRYESRWFSIYSPVSYNAKKDFGWGIGFNVGVFYIGSGSVLSNLIKSDIKNADVHVGIHVPIFRAKASKKEKNISSAEPAQLLTPEPIRPEPKPVINEPKIAAQQPAPTPQPLPEERPELVLPEPTVDPKVQEEIQRLANSIYFVTGSDWLPVESREPLTKIAIILNNDPDLHLDISGFTDNTGTEKVNMVLSKQRAKSVKKFLVDLGVDPYRINTEGLGSEDPVADNETTAGKAKNRRVEMKLNY